VRQRVHGRLVRVLAGGRPVRVPGGREPRRSGHCRSQPVRGDRLHHDQLHRRRALRRDRPEDSHHVSALAFRFGSRSRRHWIPHEWRQPLAVTGLVIAAAWLVVAIFAPLIAPHGPLEQSFTAAQSPSLDHLFGTDELGRDVLSRVIYGSRVSLPIALLLVGLAATIGGLLGAVAGYFRGALDGITMRAADLV